MEEVTFFVGGLGEEEGVEGSVHAEWQYRSKETIPPNWAGLCVIDCGLLVTFQLKVWVRRLLAAGHRGRSTDCTSATNASCPLPCPQSRRQVASTSTQSNPGGASLFLRRQTHEAND